jgi:predicted DCC family thiol-disulfide oxidoreductase YuxK
VNPAPPRAAPENGWTGGQYSVLRALFGLAVAARFALRAPGAEPVEAALHLAGVAFSLSFALGWKERASAFLLAPTLIAAGFVGGERGPGQVHWLALAVLLHLAVPPAPFLSLDARGRVDPRGNWTLPNFVRALAVAACAGSLATWWLFRSEPLLAPLFYALLACDPGWIPALRARGPERVFYDGSCGLCHRSVRFVLSEDRSPEPLTFAPIGGACFAREFASATARELPDSVLVRTADGRTLVRSRAARHIAARLGGLWRLLATLGALVPAPLLDLGYSGVARVRRRLFAPPTEACPLLPPDLRGRFEH